MAVRHRSRGGGDFRQAPQRRGREEAEAGKGRAQVVHRACGWAKWLMQSSHKGAWGQLRQIAQRLGSQRQMPPGLGKPGGEAIPLNSCHRIWSIYFRHRPDHKWPTLPALCDQFSHLVCLGHVRS